MFLRVSGKVFHSLDAAAMNARLSIVANVLKLGLESRNRLFDLRPYFEFFWTDNKLDR